MHTIKRLLRTSAMLTYIFVITMIIRTLNSTQKNYASGPEPFQCKTASEDEIRTRCLALGKSDEYSRFVILCYRSGKTRKEIAAELNIAEGTVKKYKHDRTIEMERPL